MLMGKISLVLSYFFNIVRDLSVGDGVGKIMPPGGDSELTCLKTDLSDLSGWNVDW